MLAPSQQHMAASGLPFTDMQCASGCPADLRQSQTWGLSKVASSQGPCEKIERCPLLISPPSICPPPSIPFPDTRTVVNNLGMF